MTLDADLIVDRRRARRKLAFWRLVAFLLLAAVLAAVVFALYGDRIGRGQPHIARITVSGMILADRPTDEMLATIADDPAVKGVIVAIDSPGGSTAGGEALYEGLRAIAAKKPVVATMGTLAASAGYMTAIAADHIVAARTTITGSIGVLFQYGNVGRLMQTLGVEVKAVKSAPLKAEPSPFTYPEVPGAAEALKRLIDDSFAWFVDIVAERRHLDRATVLTLADGTVYTGRQALDLKLVDAIGGEAEARDWLDGKGVSKALPVIDWAPDRGFSGWSLGSSLLGAALGIDLAGLGEAARLDGLVSLWHPQAAAIE